MSYSFLFIHNTPTLVGQLGQLGQEFLYLLDKTDAAQQRQQVAHADVMGLAFLKLTDGENADARPYGNFPLSEVAEYPVLLISLFKSKYGDKYLNIFSYLKEIYLFFASFTYAAGVMA